MCIICVKPKNKTLPDVETLKTCFIKNPHGAGIMYPDNGEIHIIKGLMDFNALLDALNAIKDSKNIPIVIHFRYATHGNKSAGNTHPYPLIADFNALQCTDILSESGFCHNGIMAQYGSESATLSDSAFFAKMLSGLRTEKSIKRALFAHSDGYNNKFVVMLKPDKIIRVGKFMKFAGCFYSNIGYKPMVETKVLNLPFSQSCDFSFWKEEYLLRKEKQSQLGFIDIPDVKPKKYMIGNKEVTKEEFFNWDLMR